MATPTEQPMWGILPGTGRNGSLQRAFEILELLAGRPEGASVATLAQESDLPRSTVSRLLASLFDAGAVARPGSDRRWVLGPTITRLTNAMAPWGNLQIKGRQVLEEITEQLGETSMLAVPTGPTTARILDEVQGPKLVGVRNPWVGKSIDSPASGFVRQLLAELPEEVAERFIGRMEFVPHTPKTKVTAEDLRREVEGIRAKQYNCVVDELEDGLSGMGVAVRQDGRLIAMLATYMPTIRFTADVQDLALKTLQRAAQKLAPSLVSF